IDGYLCEVKDIQVKDGLHVLGRPPEGEQLRGLVAAMLRLPGLRAAVGAALGVDEAGRDAVDRLEATQAALLDSLDARDWDAEAVLERHVREAGELPRMVGLVAWGTSAMRTQGDDVAEILALLGVRPVWHPETQRVTGLEVIALEELGRPRVDVTVRISGFFR